MKTLTIEKALELTDRMDKAVEQFEEVMKALLAECEALRVERLYRESDERAGT